jgi:hypothetical protein
MGHDARTALLALTAIKNGLRARRGMLTTTKTIW